MNKPDATSSVAEVLGRIRDRLRCQARSTALTSDRGVQAAGAASADMAVLRQLVAEAQAAQRRVGVINPRPSGLHNDLIQYVKKLMRRALGWYTRPLVDYQAATTQFLAEAAQLLERQQTQLRGLEEVLVALSADLAELRERLQSRLDGIEREREISRQPR